MPEPFYIVGPTAIGKTDLAARAAELCGAEIVNADAFQVYAGLACLTAQPSAEARARARHHLVGHVPLAEAYNVARFRAEATACLQEIAARGRRAIVVGGAGLYVKALTHGLSPLPPANPALRAELENTTLPVLVARLQALDPATAAAIDHHNKRRVVRAVEICITTNVLPSAQRTAWQEPRPPVRGVFLTRERDDLLVRIHRRTVDLLEESCVEEVRAASRAGVSANATKIIGFAEIIAYLAGEMGRAQCLERIEIATRQYAKRQMTWFRREMFAETIHLAAGEDSLLYAERLAARISDTSG